jgi:two-component system, OmpR family, phosphate regulon response regulator OmpR
VRVPDLRVLVVDDEPDVLDLCREVLSRLGYEVDCAPDGETALRKITTDPVDLLVVGYQMPGLTGGEVICRARLTNPEIRSILMTGTHTREAIAAALDVGVNGVLGKPFSPDELIVIAHATLIKDRKPQIEVPPPDERYEAVQAAEGALREYVRGATRVGVDELPQIAKPA